MYGIFLLKIIEDFSEEIMKKRRRKTEIVFEIKNWWSSGLFFCKFDLT